MNYHIEVLKEGYSYLSRDKQSMVANGTSTLIKGPGVNILVDTMNAWNSQFLIEALKRNGIKCENVHYVVCTHGHSDHIGNLNLFQRATQIVGMSVSSGDVYQLHPFEKGMPYRIARNIEVIPTPGHTLSDVSVVVKSTNCGTVVIAGDLFERKEDIKDISLWRDIAGSENPNLQLQSREHVLSIADYIIPGHGPMFKVTSELREIHASIVKSELGIALKG
ncbi:metallo-beta-lactamase domain-containing protein 1-like [Limulus polyphemus]|uniref:Metallo-beta-lactamase domain-containing protein 1 n=1 Tax=Limulus polyphemus TaxID=6850 RepID=A0ABM1S5L7_LIMPO|nr:metallo-beta-lactamase domain-containing protein 1-like [Limulus polyphemus]XP_022238922.1 metallo-beta-lactamase domain-containing protein 1-like [Limulus polyphemus]